MKFNVSVTFEADGREPVFVREAIEAPAHDEAAQRGVFRALKKAPRKYDSLVVVVERVA